MSKRNSILIISAVAILIIGGILFFYFSSNKNTNTTTVATSTNPFGNTSEYNSNNNTNSGQTNSNQQTDNEIIQNTNKLSQIYKNPTSGSVFIKNKDNQNVLRFVDRAVGNVYEYIPETQTSVNRVTNTTIPKIQEAVWSSVGNKLILRYLENDTDTITSFSGKIEAENTSSSTDSLGKITGSFLSTNIGQLIANPKGDKLFALVDKSDRSGTYGFTTNFDGSSKKSIFDSSILYWNISWPKENIITFTTKPNSKDVGLLYFFNTQTYSMDRILGNIIGLSTKVNRDADLVAYSYSTNNAFAFDVYDVKNKISKNFKVSALVDKCVWGISDTKILYCAIPKSITEGNYPEIWYQGLVSFSDNIWKLDIENGIMTTLYEAESDGVTFDAIDLNISSDDKYLSFSNKNDLSLWLLELN